MNQWKNFSKGFIKENAVFALFLGLCPTLGVTTSAINGLGMGLAISRTIVENHDGELWAENIPDGGAAFRFTLAVPAPLPRRQSDAE